MTTKLEAIKARHEESLTRTLGCNLAEIIARADIPALLRVVEAAQKLLEETGCYDLNFITGDSGKMNEADNALRKALAELNQPATAGETEGK